MCESFLYLVHFVINIAPVIVLLLNPLLFSLNFSYLNLWFSPFVPPILSSQPQKEEGNWGRAHWAWRVSVETLNLGIPFLNHNSCVGGTFSKRGTILYPHCRVCKKSCRNAQSHAARSCATDEQGRLPSPGSAPLPKQWLVQEGRQVAGRPRGPACALPTSLPQHHRWGTEIILITSMKCLHENSVTVESQDVWVRNDLQIPASFNPSSAMGRVIFNPMRCLKASSNLASNTSGDGALLFVLWNFTWLPTLILGSY